MRIVLRILLVLVVLVALAAGGVFLILKPPAPLALPEQGVVLNDVTLIEPGVERLEHRRVVVRGGEIASVSAAEPGGGPYAGMYVLPGLTDMHVHFPPSSLAGQTELFSLLFLLHGVTTVRDAGDVDGTATEPARKGIAEGRFPGPRVEACGYFIDGDPPLWKHSIVARNPEEGRKAVATVAEQGYDCVKAYNGLDAPTLAAIQDEAAKRKLPVIGHVPYRIPYEQAKLADAQHLIGIPPPVDAKLRFPFVLVAYDQLDDQRLDFVIGESVRSHIANTPTLVTIDRLIQSQDYEKIRQEPDAQLLPRFYRDVVWNPDGGTSVAGQMKSQDFDMVRRAFETMKRTVRKMYLGGVRLHTGTDTLIAFVVPGSALHRELRILVDAGFTPEEALALSTRDSAADLGVEKLGSLQPGAPADFVVYREDPTHDLAALDTIAGVVRDGRFYSRQTLDEQLARYREHFDSPLFDAIVTPIVRRVLASTREH